MGAARRGKATGTARWLAGASVFALIAAVATLYFALVFVPRERAVAVEVWRGRLSAMADDRKAAIDAWLDERRDDAKVVADYPTVVALLAGQDAMPLPLPPSEQPQQHLQRLLDSVKATHGYAGLSVVDATARVRARGAGTPPLAATCQAFSEQALRSGAIQVDFFATETGAPMLAIVAPVSVAGRPIGTVVQLMDPGRWLYPLLRAEPVPSRSAESLLGRQVGGQIEYLSPLRHRPGRPLSVRLPVNAAPLAMVAAIHGSEEFKEYPDYRGVPVLGVPRRIPGTDWGLVVKVDRVEALADFGLKVRQGATALVGLLLALAGLGFGAQRTLAARHRRELGESEARFELLAEVAPVGIFRTDEHGATTYVNRCWTELSGLTADRALGDGWLQAVHPEDRDRLVAGWRDATQARHESLADYRFLRPDGTVTWVAGKASAVLDAAGHFTGYVGTITDITERKQVAAALSASEVRYRRLFEAAQDGVLILDAETGTIVDVNPFLIGLLGYPFEVLVGRKVWELGFFADVAANEAKFEELRRKDFVRYDNLELETADGRRVQVEFISNAYLEDHHRVIQCNIRDITEHRRAEAALIESENQLRAMFDLASVGIAQTDPRTGRWVRVNRRMCAITGYTEEELLDLRISDITYPDDRQEDWEAFQRVVRGEAEEYRLEKRYVRKDGSLAWVNVNMTVILDEAGHPVRTIATIEDITERKRAEEALKESESRIRRVLETMSLLGLVLDVEGNIMLCNDYLLGLTGWTREEVLGRNWFDLFVPAKVDQEVRDIFLKTISTGDMPVHHQNEIVTRTGERRLIAWNNTVLKDHDGAIVGVASIGEDVTQRQRAEAAVAASERKYRQLFEAADDAIVIFEPATEVILEANRRACELYGFRRDELLGRSLKTLTVDVARGEHQIAVLCQAGVYRNFESVQLRRDGARFPVLINATLIELDGREVVLSLTRDMTEVKRAQEVLRESEERYRDLVESSSDLICTHDLNGRFVSANAAALRAAGLGLEELLGLTIRDLIVPEHRAEVDTYLEVIRREGMASGVMEVRSRSGEERYWEYNNSLRTEGVSAPVVRGIARDITERKRAKAERKKLEEQLRQSQKMEAVGHLAGGVAHDFNNLLQAMLSVTQMLGAHLSDPERLKADAAELEQLVKRGAALTRQLLLFSRRETVRPERLDVNDAVRESVKMLRRLLKENVALEMRLAEGSLPVDADRGQLGQVLINLAVNAADAMPGGGRLLIETGSGDSGIWVKVADTGTGIPAAIQDHVFEPFFTTKAQGKGTGLGLPVVHGIVTKHGGTVTFESREGKGTTFCVALPRAGSEEHLAAGIAALAGDAPRGRGERVLVVEDEDSARQALLDILTMLGYTVTAVGSGEEAGRLASEEQFDLLLTDLLLPGISGNELAAELKARRPDLRVVLMSGYTEDDAVRLASRTGAVRFLQKPFDMDTLARELRAALETA